MLTYNQAKNLREQFSPAFAGYLTDGDISDRDVLATIMDLVVKGAIKLDAELKGESYSVKGLKLLSVKDFLKPFEKEFLGVLFGNKNEISISEARNIIKSKALHRSVKKNLDSIQDYPVVKSELKFFTKRGTPVYFEINDQKVNSKEMAERFASLDKIFIPAFVFFGLLCIFVAIISKALIPFFAGLVFIMFPIWARIAFKRTKKVMRMDFKKDIVPIAKKKYQELFEFLQKYPLKTQRLHNEFMPFAVAFGLDPSWNESFGIKKELFISPEQAEDKKSKLKIYLEIKAP